MNRRGGTFLAFITLLAVGIVGTYSFLYIKKGQEEIKAMHIRQENLQKDLKKLFTKQRAQLAKPTEILDGNQKQLANQSTTWINIQKQSKDTVVQVYSHLTGFNWLEPYKTPAQGEGAGSGFFINENGDIITNYHVVAQASTIQIQIPTFGMERFDADLIGASPERDIALLKITDAAREKIRKKITTIPYLKLGDSDDILRSQEVLALGYPLGQTRLKSTLGIVSGRERLGYFGYIQVTTPLNPGNSGGPAVNTEGRVIGINSRGVTAAQNVGYIIPINEVKSALDDLYHVKLLRKPTLGCIFTVATEEMVDFLGNPEEGGWYIAKVFDSTLLKDAGVQKDDMLFEVNGHKIDMYGELNVPWSEDKVSLFELLNRYKVGDTLNFLIYRKGKPLNISFKLEHKYLPPIRTIYPEFEKERTEYEIIGGMIVMELTLNHVSMLLNQSSELVKYGRVENQHKQAIIVTHILPNSQAYKARVLRAGEIIDEVNGTKVQSLQDFREAVLKNKAAEYLTVRTSDNLYAVLSVAKLIKDEQRLSSQFFYPISPLVNELMR